MHYASPQAAYESGDYSSGPFNADTPVYRQPLRNHAMILAGPCSLTSDREKMMALARDVKAAGATAFRCKFLVGGSFPPKGGEDDPLWGVRRTGRELLWEISGILPVSCELRADYLHGGDEIVLDWDMVSAWWVPARQMQNYELVRGLARQLAPTQKHLLIKRAPYARLRDVQGIVEHVREVGFPMERLWIVERGVTTFDHEGQWTFRTDPLFIPRFKDACPGVRVITDASHGAGDHRWVDEAALAGVAAGADGLMMEVFTPPEESPTDTALAISPEKLGIIVAKAKHIWAMMGTP